MRPNRWQPSRLPRPWDFPGKSTGVGCHCFLHPRHYTRALLTGSPVNGRRREIVVGSAAAVADGRKPPGKEAFLLEVLEVKGERRGSVEWCWGRWILEPCFDVERTVQWIFFFFFNLKMPGQGWSNEFGLGEGSRLSLAVRTTANGVWIVY